MKKLHILAFGLTAGLLWGFAVFGLAIASLYWDVATPIVDLLGSGYLGYKATWGGALIGGLEGFFDVGLGALIFAWLYNFFSKKFK
ncbi:hypothetical protein KAR91_84265 [Candidatus Pacearchaeota archaeon]|nr:hypothetical protein [Candidatus Pacearchaeota archaeon]